MSNWMLILALFSIMTYAILGGVFLAFSDFIMRALRVTGNTAGPEAMQAINREVFRYVFMSLFIGMVPVSLVLGVGAYLTISGPTLFIASAVIYIAGAFGVTIICNVPMNNALAAYTTVSTEAVQYWNTTYVPRWTFWNSIRTAACLLASALLLYGVVRAVSI